METVNTHQAKTHLSRLLARAANGESFIIAKSGKPVAKIIPYEETPIRKKRRIGFMSGQVKVPADFDTMAAEEIERLFSGER